MGQMRRMHFFFSATKGQREREREGKRKGEEKGKGELEVKLWQQRKKSQTSQPGIEPGTPANGVPGSIPGWGVCDYFHFCQSFTSNFPFPFSFPFLFPSLSLSFRPLVCVSTVVYHRKFKSGFGPIETFFKKLAALSNTLSLTKQEIFAVQRSRIFVRKYFSYKCIRAWLSDANIFSTLKKRTKYTKITLFNEHKTSCDYSTDFEMSLSSWMTGLPQWFHIYVIWSQALTCSIYKRVCFLGAGGAAWAEALDKRLLKSNYSKNSFLFHLGRKTTWAVCFCSLPHFSVRLFFSWHISYDLIYPLTTYPYILRVDLLPPRP